MLHAGSLTRSRATASSSDLPVSSASPSSTWIMWWGSSWMTSSHLFSMLPPTDEPEPHGDGLSPRLGVERVLYRLRFAISDCGCSLDLYEASSVKASHGSTCGHRRSQVPSHASEIVPTRPGLVPFHQESIPRIRTRCWRVSTTPASSRQYSLRIGSLATIQPCGTPTSENQRSHLGPKRPKPFSATSNCVLAGTSMTRSSGVAPP